jgi:two-component system, cell cycle response regulator
MRILVADDDATSRRIVRIAVERLAHDCQVVADGTQAWEAFQAGHPDVVICDRMMPGQTGVQLCQNIRAHPSGSNVYLILLTSQGAHDQILEGMEAGADDYLVKPLNPDDLEIRLVAAGRVTALHGKLADQRGQLERLNTELISLARHDSLTGLRNRRVLEEDLETLGALVGRYGHRYCMTLLDVDHFKAYNDAYGHLAGDEVLRAVGSTLRDQIRTGDAVYRYGGEEFLCIVPEQRLPAGMQAAERMRAGVQSLNIAHPLNRTGVVTLSAGVATLDPDCVRAVREVLQEADEALYLAKEHGRNRVESIQAIIA